MNKRKLDSIAPKAPPELLELEDFQDEPIAESEQSTDPNAWQRAPLWARILGSLTVLIVLLALSFELVYAGKIYPGVSADGVYLGGQTKKAAGVRLNQKITAFGGQVITLADGDTRMRIPVAQLGIKYDTPRAVESAYNYGRQGTWQEQFIQKVKALLGQNTDISTYSYDHDGLVPYMVELSNDVATTVQNASLNFDDHQAQVTPAETGARLDLGRLAQLIDDRLAQTSTDPITAPVYQLTPSLDTVPLQAAVEQIDNYVSAPITLIFSGVDRQIDQKTIISWIQVGSKPTREFLTTLKLEDIKPAPPSAKLTLDEAAIKAYVADLAKSIDQTPQNAGLVMQDGQLTVAQASQTGIKVDQAAAIKDIKTSLKASDDRRVELVLETTKAAVREDNLAELGIKELISEGESFFPGSPSTRLTNVRAGAKRFNGILLKPDEVFSFGALLGAVGPETGYVPELVILQNHEEKQYGGGLCQVSSTAFRAALAAGLPILERHNHSFAISYYTAPYGVPGVDATIYYPQVDFKFKNDTGSYILIQTTMEGTTLKFDYYGTKTKTGTIRGPEFISGTTDATQPSHTVFYRDIHDLDGKVTKTDTFHTYYKSSKDFPITEQFN